MARSDRYITCPVCGKGHCKKPEPKLPLKIEIKKAKAE